MGKPWFMYNVTRGFTDMNHGNHDGWDFGAPSHTPVYSLTGGKVTSHTGWKPWGGEVDTKGGVLGGGVTETFAHLDRIDVKAGDTVFPGQQVGLSGGEGLPAQYSTGPHIHYSLFGGAPWDNKFAIDPGGFLKGFRDGLSSTGGNMGFDPADVGAGLNALAKTIDDAYTAAESALKLTIKRTAYFILGMVLVGVGILVLITAVALKAGGKAEQVARPYAQAAAKVL